MPASQTDFASHKDAKERETIVYRSPVCHGALQEVVLWISSPIEATAMPNKIQNLHTADETSFSYIFEQNASVALKSSEGLIRLNVYRPKNAEKVPVLVTYGPYGKDIPYKE